MIVLKCDHYNSQDFLGLSILAFIANYKSSTFRSFAIFEKNNKVASLVLNVFYG